MHIIDMDRHCRLLDRSEGGDLDGSAVGGFALGGFARGHDQRCVPYVAAVRTVRTVILLGILLHDSRTARSVCNNKQPKPKSPR